VVFQKIGPPADLVSFVQNLAIEFVCCVENLGLTKVTVIKPIRCRDGNLPQYPPTPT
jgi:hypothetical protein